MQSRCPRCEHENRPIARFCGRCGLSLAVGVDGTRWPGRVAHPQPRPVPDGFQRCEQTPDLYVQCRSAFGGQALLGTEGLRIRIFNAGYALAHVTLHLRGVDRAGGVCLDVRPTLERLPRGESVEIEVPSYEIHAPLDALRVLLEHAEYADERAE